MNTSQQDQNKFPFDLEIQYAILKMMLTKVNFLTKALCFLKEEYFENAALGWFFKFIDEFYCNYNKTPEIITIKNEINKLSITDRPKYERIMEKIEFCSYNDEEYLLKETTGWLRSRKFIDLHSKVADLFNNNQRDSAYDFTANAIEELRDLNLSGDKYIDFLQWEEIQQRQADSVRQRIPTGIIPIDKAMYGGLARQGLTTILGTTNSGKSLTMINMAYHMILSGKKVLFLYHEGSDDQMATRFMCRFANIPYSRFMRAGALGQDDIDRIQHTKRLLSDRLFLKPWQKFGLTVDEVISYTRAKKSEFDFDCIIDDYVQLLGIKTPTNELRHNQARVCEALSQLAAELNVAVVTAAQGNRGAQIAADDGDRLVRMTDISECFHICRTSECVITMTRSNEDKINNTVKFLLDKQREGPTGIAVECRSDIDRLIMYDVSLGVKNLRLAEDGTPDKEELDANQLGS